MAVLLAFVLLLGVMPVAAQTVAGVESNDPIWQIINTARGYGAFSYEFELAPTAAQIESGQHGQRGIVEGKDGLVRVFNRNANGTYSEATNSVVMSAFARNFRLLTQYSGETTFTYELPLPAWLGFDGNGFSGENYVFMPLTTHEILTNAGNRFNKNLPSTDLSRENTMMFVVENGVIQAAQFMNIATNAYVYKRIYNFKPELSGVTPSSYSTKTQLWWIIDAARGNGEFSFNFELEDGTTGLMTGNNGVINVYDAAGNIVNDSTALTVFGNHFAFLTQRNHNHNNEINGTRPYEPPFPEWLELTNNGIGFANGNYELFPLVTNETLTNAVNPFEINLVTPDINRESAMLFIYDGGEMRAMQFNVNGEYVFMKISNLQNTIAGEESEDAYEYEIYAIHFYRNTMVIYTRRVRR